MNIILFFFAFISSTTCAMEKFVTDLQIAEYRSSITNFFIKEIKKMPSYPPMLLADLRKNCNMQLNQIGNVTFLKIFSNDYIGTKQDLKKIINSLSPQESIINDLRTLLAEIELEKDKLSQDLTTLLSNYFITKNFNFKFNMQTNKLDWDEEYWIVNNQTQEVWQIIFSGLKDKIIDL